MKETLSTHHTELPVHLPKQGSYIDLHMHSLYSDGLHSVTELVAMAAQNKVRALSLTDHDTLDGLAEAQKVAHEHNIEFVSGVEISTFDNNSEIHILGYLFDPTHLGLNLKLAELQNNRRQRAAQIIAKLEKQGISISLDRVFEKAKGTSVGRPHIAAVMLEEEYVSSYSEAFEKYLHLDFVREFELNKPTPKFAIELISEAGGIPVLAHPAKYNRDDLLESFVASGLIGIETFCPGMDKQSSLKYRSLAKKWNLICSGGSDFHCDRPGMRCGVGSLPVPYETLDQMRTQLLRRVA